MTDPFADLERELLRAHARERSPRRRLRRAARPAAVLSSVAAAALAGAWLADLAPEEPERATSPQPTIDEGWTGYAPLSETGDPVPGECQTPYEPKATSDPIPSELLDLLGVLRRPMDDPDRAPLPAFMFSSQAVRFYEDGRRRVGEADAGAFLWPADIVSRDQVATGHRTCDQPTGDVAPGACLAAFDDGNDGGGALSACFSPREIREGEAFIDRDREVTGLAPDGVRRVRSAHATADVRDNFFVLPSDAGPDTEIAFVE